MYLQGSAGETVIETDLWTQGGGGEGEMRGESNMETYITMCKIESQWGFAVCLRELKQGLCNNLEGCDGEGDGREAGDGGDKCTPMTDSC